MNVLSTMFSDCTSSQETVFSYFIYDTILICIIKCNLLEYICSLNFFDYVVSEDFEFFIDLVSWVLKLIYMPSPSPMPTPSVFDL